MVYCYYNHNNFEENPLYSFTVTILYKVWEILSDHLYCLKGTEHGLPTGHSLYSLGSVTRFGYVTTILHSVYKGFTKGFSEVAL